MLKLFSPLEGYLGNKIISFLLMFCHFHNYFTQIRIARQLYMSKQNIHFCEQEKFSDVDGEDRLHNKVHRQWRQAVKIENKNSGIFSKLEINSA